MREKLAPVFAYGRRQEQMTHWTSNSHSASSATSIRPEDDEGFQISLYVQDGLIVGRIDNADGMLNAGGDVAFAVAIDPLGGVNIAQYLSLETRCRVPRTTSRRASPARSRSPDCNRLRRRCCHKDASNRRQDRFPGRRSGHAHLNPGRARLDAG